MRKIKTLFACKILLSSIFFSFFFVYSVYTEDAGKNKNNDNALTAEDTCESMAPYLDKGEKNRKLRIAQKNKIFLCRAVVEKVIEDFSKMPEELISKSRWIAKLKKPYLLILKPASPKLKNVAFYLYSSKEEVAEVLAPGTNIEFSGQLLFEPFVEENIWRMVFVNQEAAIKI